MDPGSPCHGRSCLTNRRSDETPLDEVDKLRNIELLAEPLPSPIRDQPPFCPDFGNPPVSLDMVGTELSRPKEDNNFGYSSEEDMDSNPGHFVWTRNPVGFPETMTKRLLADVYHHW